MFERESFSPSMSGVSSSNKEPSHPCKLNQSATQSEQKIIEPRPKRKQREFYIDETIMKLQAHNRGATPWLSNHGLFDHFPNRGFGLWTALGVVTWPERRLCGGRGDDMGDEEQERKHWREMVRKHVTFFVEVMENGLLERHDGIYRLFLGDMGFYSLLNFFYSVIFLPIIFLIIFLYI